MSESVYRKEWIKHYGPIPRDHKGRSYHIHHIDRDRSNNHISNLVVLSILDIISKNITMPVSGEQLSL